MQLVNHGLGKGAAEGLVALPVVTAWIGDHAFHGRADRAPEPTSDCAAVVVGHGDGEAVRIEEQLLGIEPEPQLRCEGPVGTIAIELPWLEIRYKGMPVVIRAMRLRIERDDA